jgi:proline dehydrogenase
MLQFVGGDEATDVVPLIETLRSQKKGVLLAYSVEVDEDEAIARTNRALSSSDSTLRVHGYKRNVLEMTRSIDVAAEFEDAKGLKDDHGGRKTWVAVKLVSGVKGYHAFL